MLVVLPEAPLVLAVSVVSLLQLEPPFVENLPLRARVGIGGGGGGEGGRGAFVCRRALRLGFDRADRSVDRDLLARFAAFAHCGFVVGVAAVARYELVGAGCRRCVARRGRLAPGERRRERRGVQRRLAASFARWVDVEADRARRRVAAGDGRGIGDRFANRHRGGDGLGCNRRLRLQPSYGRRSRGNAATVGGVGGLRGVGAGCLARV